MRELWTRCTRCQSGLCALGLRFRVPFSKEYRANRWTARPLAIISSAQEDLQCQWAVAHWQYPMWSIAMFLTAVCKGTAPARQRKGAEASCAQPCNQPGMCLSGGIATVNLSTTHHCSTGENGPSQLRKAFEVARVHMTDARMARLLAWEALKTALFLSETSSILYCSNRESTHTTRIACLRCGCFAICTER